MNNTFSFSRFWHLVRIQLRETNWFWIQAVCFFLALTAGLYLINDARSVEQLRLFVLMRMFVLNQYWMKLFCIVGLCWTHFAVQRYVTSGRSTLAYMLPATQGEKFAAMWFLSTVAYPVVAMAVAALSWAVLQIPGKHVPVPWSVFTFQWHEIFCFMLPLQAVQILCGAWARRSMVKYYLIGAIAITGAMYCYYALEQLLKPLAGCDVNLSDRIRFIGHNTIVQYDFWTTYEWLALVIIATCYVAALFKFRERNVL